MTRRPRVDQLTDDMLDQLYADLDALKAITAGYCGHCGRGDCSPTADQWLEQRQRAEQAEAAIARVRALHSRWEYDQNDCSVCVDCYGAPVPYPCPTLRALDGTA
ncbi:hypothetical protein [Streptosporangium amethystogenes]|uniref:hypothetical protein n=1 Tax=Streptosporangium amethystogenes TaxID=2002 RepID=UPI0004BD1641|nr:hypothetical protein [Streptosporangium amethystogenes]KUJ65415.1 hypothetical protein ACZ90_47935 [Streptomyces albus subsp. albus]